MMVKTEISAFVSIKVYNDAYIIMKIRINLVKRGKYLLSTMLVIFNEVVQIQKILLMLKSTLLLQSVTEK